VLIIAIVIIGSGADELTRLFTNAGMSSLEIIAPINAIAFIGAF
jgi:hypothetical protein